MKRLTVFIICLSIAFMRVTATVSREYDATDLDTPLETESVQTAATAGAPEIKAQSAILTEVQTGEILWEMNADEQLAPASITKIMSLLLVMEAIEDGRLTLDTVVTASEHACSMGGSQIWLEPNEQMTVDELLKAAVIASANDATVALGEHIAGSEEGFVAMMNERAKELGMNGTNFINCTGLDADGHLTTAHDVAVMSGELIKHDLIKQYSTVWMDSLRGGESELVNTNKLVRFYEGCTGLKTGTTSTAGYCLSATAERDGTQMVAVIMNGETSTERFEGAKKLLNYGFANFSFTEIAADLKDAAQLRVEKGVKDSVKLEADGKLKLLLPKNTTGEIRQEVSLEDSVAAPVSEGDKVGKVTFIRGDEVLGEVDIVASEDVERINITQTLFWLLKALCSL